MSGTQTVELFTDGACRGNPGPGGWGALLRFKGTERELYGYEPETTNNRMELTAAIRGLEALKRPCSVDLTTDSEYLRKGVTEWMAQWKRRGWRTAAKKPVANRDLWEELDALLQKHEVRFHWIRGHTGHEGNERADSLANRAIDEAHA
jgi:ribonuclease HI